MIKRNVNTKGFIKVSPWRKLSFGMWSGPHDAQVVADTEYILPTSDPREASAFLASAVSKAISEYPQLNSILRFKRFYERKNVDIFFHVAGSPIQDDLTGIVIRKTEEKTIREIGEELKTGARNIREGRDVLFGGLKSTAQFVPTFFLRTITKVLNFVMYDLNLWIPVLGMGRDPFGSFMITNLGAIGCERANVPLPRFGSIALVFCMGRMKGRNLPVSLTFDHRRMDGAMAIDFNARVQSYLDKSRTFRSEEICSLPL